MSAKRRHKKQKSPFKWHKKPVPFGSKVKNASRRVWTWVVSAAVVIGLWASWVEFKPSLHTEPFRQLNPASPFSEAFTVSNDGKLAVYNLKFYCHIIAAHKGTAIYEDNQMDAEPSKLSTILSSGSTTIYCPIERATGNDSPDKYTRAQITFRVTFQHLLHPWGTQDCFQFLGVLDSDNRVQWTHLNNNCPINFKDY